MLKWVSMGIIHSRYSSERLRISSAVSYTHLPAIGVILSESMAYLSAGMWWLAVFPGLALIATVLLFDLAGSSLRKLVDPHSAQE